MPELSDLPKEVHLSIARHLLPAPLLKEDRWRSQLACSAVKPLYALRCVSRHWKTISDDTLSTCVFREGDLQHPPQAFKELLSKISRPSRIHHLHLSTNPRCTKHARLYTSSFSRVDTVEVANVDSAQWPELVAAMSQMPALRNVVFHRKGAVWGFASLPSDGEMTAPSAPDSSLLRQVTSVVATGFKSVAYLDKFLQWFQGLKSLDLEADCAGADVDGLGNALRHCKATLQELNLGWQMLDADDPAHPVIDLTDLSVLERVSLCSFTTTDQRPKDWKFPTSVKWIDDTEFNQLPWFQPSVHTSIAAVRHFATIRRSVAPGICQLVLHIRPAFTEIERMMLLIVRQFLEDGDCKLVCEGVDLDE